MPGLRHTRIFGEYGIRNQAERNQRRKTEIKRPKCRINGPVNINKSSISLHNHEKKIPKEPFDVQHSISGFLPDVGIHKKGDVYIQEPSYSFWLFLLVMLAVSICVLFLPLKSQTKYIIAGGLIWSGICVLIPWFIMKAFSRKIIIDKTNGLLKIIQKKEILQIPISELTGLQIIFHKKRSQNGLQDLSGYQLILVRGTKNGNCERYFLYKHKARSFVKALAKKYEYLLGLKRL